MGGALRFVVKVAKEYAWRARGANYEADLVRSLISAGNLGLLVAVDRFEPARKTRFLTYAAWWIREKILEELDNTEVVRVPAYRQKALRAERKYTGAGRRIIVIGDLDEIDQHRPVDDDTERDAINNYGSDFLHEALSALGLRGRDRYIVLAYFGVREEPKNLRQISNRLGLSSERVRQIKKEVLARLQHYLETKDVTDVADVFTP